MSGNEVAIRRLVRFLTMSTLISALVAAAVVVGMTSAGAQEEPIRLDQLEKTWVHNDFDGDGRFDMGDRVVVRGPLVDPATGDRVGQAQWECTAMTFVRVEAQHGTWLCTGLLRLPQGDLVLEGPDPAGFGDSVFAVTGGTGPYRAARGEADVVDAPNPEHTEITLHLEP
jgi:hypothetical protein